MQVDFQTCKMLKLVNSSRQTKTSPRTVVLFSTCHLLLLTLQQPQPPQFSAALLTTSSAFTAIFGTTAVQQPSSQTYLYDSSELPPASCYFFPLSWTQYFYSSYVNQKASCLGHLQQFLWLVQVPRWVKRGDPTYLLRAHQKLSVGKT